MQLKYLTSIILCFTLISCSTTKHPQTSVDIKQPHIETEDKTNPAIAIPSLHQKLDTRLIYKAKWNGLTVGDATIDIIPKEDQNYHVKAYAKANGLVYTITKYHSTTDAIINAKDKTFKPISHYKHTAFNRKKERTVTVNYKNNKVSGESIVPPEREGKRKKVPAKLKHHAYNPVSVIFSGWQAVVDHMEKHEGKLVPREFVLPIYDGRRRSDAHVKITGKTQEGLIEVVGSVTPVEGYTGREKEAFEKSDYFAKAYLSRDAFLPVKIIGESKLGNVLVMLDSICPKRQQNCYQTKQ